MTEEFVNFKYLPVISPDVLMPFLRYTWFCHQGRQRRWIHQASENPKPLKIRIVLPIFLECVERMAQPTCNRCDPSSSLLCGSRLAASDPQASPRPRKQPNYSIKPSIGILSAFHTRSSNSFGQTQGDRRDCTKTHVLDQLKALISSSHTDGYSSYRFLCHTMELRKKTSEKTGPVRNICKSPVGALVWPETECFSTFPHLALNWVWIPGLFEETISSRWPRPCCSKASTASKYAAVATRCIVCFC